MAVLSLSKCIQMARLSSLYGEVPFGTIGYKGLNIKRQKYARDVMLLYLVCVCVCLPYDLFHAPNLTTTTSYI